MPSWNLQDRTLKTVYSLFYERRYFWHLAALAVLADAVLTQLIIRYVSFTEIDFETYIVHAELFNKGETDYALIDGPSGPIVYPAGHLWIHSALRSLLDHELSHGSLRAVQQLYGGLYLVNLAISCAIYWSAGGTPNYAILPLIFSKRLHSIYVLRLFNDCWTVLGMTISVWAYQQRKFLIGSIFFSLALSVKMNVLLYAPGVLFVLTEGVGLTKTGAHLALIASLQAVLGYPFLSTFPTAYLKIAFNFSRAFLFKWTVNWRFVPEDVFLSMEFARSLLFCHLLVLVAFGVRWCEPSGGLKSALQQIFSNIWRQPTISRMGADRVATILFACNLIGITFARSLHYQFYSWYATQISFLTWRTKYPTWVKLVILLVIEYTWNVFPSTKVSSGLLFCSNVTLILGILFGYPNGIPRVHLKVQ